MSKKISNEGESFGERGKQGTMMRKAEKVLCSLPSVIDRYSPFTNCSQTQENEANFPQKTFQITQQRPTFTLLLSAGGYVSPSLPFFSLFLSTCKLEQVL